MQRKTFLAALALPIMLLSWQARAAQDWPTRPVTLVSSFPAGSGNDLVARALAPGLADALGQPVIVENRPGAGGAIGAQYAARAKPDGYTLFLASLSFSVLPNVMDLAFDPGKDFRAVSLVGTQAMALVVPPKLPVKSMSELVAYAKAHPGKLNYASAGTGSIGHLTGELLKSESGIDIVHVPFKGTPEALTAIMTGEVQMALVAMPAAAPQIRAGKVKVLGVTGKQRQPDLPKVPTMAEAGYPSMGDSVWYAMLVPSGTPDAIVTKLNAALHKTLALRATTEMLQRSANMQPTSSTPQEADAYVHAQLGKWRDAAARAGLHKTAAK